MSKFLMTPKTSGVTAFDAVADVELPIFKYTVPRYHRLTIAADAIFRGWFKKAGPADIADDSEISIFVHAPLERESRQRIDGPVPNVRFKDASQYDADQVHRTANGGTFGEGYIVAIYVLSSDVAKGSLSRFELEVTLEKV